MVSIPKVLILVWKIDEREKLQQILAAHAELIWTSNYDELACKLKTSNYDVVFCARRPGDWNWKRVLEDVQQLDCNLPVIILSQTAHEEEWDEVLAAGAFDLLGPLYQEREVLPLVEHAVVSHEARLRHGVGGGCCI